MIGTLLRAIGLLPKEANSALPNNLPPKRWYRVSVRLADGAVLQVFSEKERPKVGSIYYHGYSQEFEILAVDAYDAVIQANQAWERCGAHCAAE